MDIAALNNVPMSIHAKSLRVTELPSLGHPVAGQFVGTVDGTLIVAGGSRWSAPSGAGRTKVFEDQIEAFEPCTVHWQLVARLPRPLAYGGAASLSHSLLFAGGLDQATASRSVWAFTTYGPNFLLTPWPRLPAPLANFSMASAGNRVYIFGGQQSSGSSASNQLWSLEFDGSERPLSEWRSEPPLPGSGRILAAATGCDEALYILGGAALLGGMDRAFERQYLDEVWSFQPSKGWERLPDLPAPSVAAPAACDGDGNIFLIGGDDGGMAAVRLNAGQLHPGFSRTIVRYRPTDEKWRTVGELPLGLVTTGCAVRKNRSFVVPGGEDRPGSRSDRVFEIHLDQ